MKQQKSVLRKEIIKKRQSLSQKEWQTKSSSVCHLIKSLPEFAEADTIFAYFSFRKEVDLSSLFSFNKNWVFPRCVGQSLVWHLWQPGEPLVKDKYGIKTPLETAPIVSASLADLILVPTVACDAKGYRLGYGGGFYDRFFSSLCSPEPIAIGIVFNFARVAQLPLEAWDIPLYSVCTETEFFNYKDNI